jgi:hypothetical protein
MPMLMLLHVDATSLPLHVDATSLLLHALSWWHGRVGCHLDSTTLVAAAAVCSPLYLILGLVSFLFLRTLYVELDVDSELQRGALPGALSLSAKLRPALSRVSCSRDIMLGAWHVGCMWSMCLQ